MSSNEVHGSPETVVRSKKRPSNTENYKKNKIKKARVQNEPYYEYNHRNRYVQENMHGNDCRCKLKCFEKISKGDRTEIYSKFISFTTKNEQDAYLQSLIRIKPFKRQRKRSAEHIAKKDKAASFSYQVSPSSGAETVCKKAFISLHGITSDRVRRLQKLTLQGKAPRDMRGVGPSANAISGTTVNAIKEHISEFPVKKAHYSSRQYRYLDEKLNVKLMWQAFSEKYPNIQVNYPFYLKVFKENFNLSFGRPQVDTCCQCEDLKLKLKSPSLNDAAKRAAAEMMIHKRRAKKFFSKMKEVTEECKANPEVSGICLDYMQNLQLPAIPIQETFYLRQLTVNVFNIHDLLSSKSLFYVYHEGQAKKGPNEVCSFMMKYINENIPSTVKHLYVFSDGCGGQNKNNTVTRFLLALVDSGRFHSINQYFPIRGHSFLPCDRNFSVAKRRLRVMDRLYSMEQICKIIEESSTKKNFSVVQIESSDVLNFKDWWGAYYKKNIISLESHGKKVKKDAKENFNISTYMHLFYQDRGIIIARKYIDNDINKHTFKFGSRSDVSLPILKVYNEGYVPINIKKVNDLKKLFPYVPEEYKNFYTEIFARPTCDVEITENLD